MKAVIQLDVPDWQIGQDVTVYFPDTMMKHAKCELLKEQEAKTHGTDSGMCEICSFYERAMPVKPHYNARTNWYKCGACHYSMTSGMYCKGILIPAYKVGFCAKCGKAVMWE